MSEDKEEVQAEKKPPYHWTARRDKEPKFSRWWRPAMGWMYMLVCIFDFIIFPAAWSWYQGYLNEAATLTQWQPLTLQGAGLFHMAMGAIVGISAWNRTVEKLADKV